MILLKYLSLTYALTVIGELRLQEIWKNMRFSPAMM